MRLAEVNQRRGTAVLGDVNASSTVTFTGDFSSVSHASSNSTSSVAIFFTTAMPNANYDVKATLASTTNGECLKTAVYANGSLPIKAQLVLHL